MVTRAAEISDTVVIKLGAVPAVPVIVFGGGSPRTLIHAVPGAHVQFVITLATPANRSIAWFRDSQRLSGSTGTLDIASVTSSDSGVYSAGWYDSDGNLVWQSERTTLLVTTAGQRLLNVSTRARVDANQPFFLSGFVVEPGPARTRLVIRAVGPTLKVFGVPDSLAMPQLRVMDANGKLVDPVSEPAIVPVIPILISEAEAEALAAGAFPLVPGGKDIAQLYDLPAGAYTAQLSASDGGSGTALLEIYQLQN